MIGDRRTHSDAPKHDRMSAMDFAPMPRRKPGFISNVLSQVSDAVVWIESQREPYAQFWDDWNNEAIAETGPLWVVLGDSSSQGLGTPDPMDGWVPQILERLRTETGEPWRVINLSITGAQFGDVATTQLERLALLRDAGQEPQLISLLAGANNLMAPNSWRDSFGHLSRVLDALPESRSLVARVGVSTPLNSLMARRFNVRIEAAAKEKDFQLFWPWAWPSRDGLAPDNWHPGTKGYRYMVDLAWPRIATIVGVTD